MTAAPAAGELSRQLDLIELLRAHNGIQTEFVAVVRGIQANGVLYSGSLLIGPDGTWHKFFAVPFAHVYLGGAAHPMTLTNDPPQGAPPRYGPGVLPVTTPLGFNLAGRVVTVYGTPGDIAMIEIDTKPRAPKMS